MNRRHQNALETSLHQALNDIGEAKNRYQRTKEIHASTVVSTTQQCQRLANMQRIAKKCSHAMTLCKQRQVGIAHLIEKRNRLRSELKALNDASGRLQRLQQVLDEADEYSWEGTYEGTGPYAGYRVTASNTDAGFRLASNRMDTAEDALGVNSTFSLGQIGEAFRFCLESSNPQSCGRAQLDSSGLVFDGIEFKKTS